ncbi:hypothetical protein CVT25_006320 [Psilocybe cyanescens]|uniref:Uncharacterized protein n=1 Tax=Psilocybe cyanescens TaxID=93625 RepID=A0A409X3U8_PSICY|nr:hypothetical protein CVT25_006320 [Psilocybe cyanescens]
MSVFNPLLNILIEGLREIQLIRYTRVRLCSDYIRPRALCRSSVEHSAATNSHEGLRVFQWEGITGLVGCIVADVTLQVRIYALYSGSKRILALMLTTYVLCVTASGWVVGTALANGEAFVVPIPIGGAVCDLRIIPLHIYAFWIPMITFQILLCILAIIPAVNSFKVDGSIMKFYSGRGLYNILIRDSTIYFAIIAVTYISCLTVWVIEQKNGLIETPIGFSVAIQCSLCSRIILNLREADQLVVSDNGTQKNAMVYGSGNY